MKAADTGDESLNTGPSTAMVGVSCASQCVTSDCSRSASDLRLNIRLPMISSVLKVTAARSSNVGCVNLQSYQAI